MTNYTHWLIRARLKTRQLLLIVALAEEGNIHRASQVLSMTQPAASKLLKDLEDVLGVQLFERLPRGMRPTWYGETMIRHARAALNSLNQANDELQAAKNGQFGQVNLGAITAPGVVLLPPTIALVKEAHPNLRITIHIDSSNVLIEQLYRGTLDLMIGRLSEQHDTADLRYETIADEPVCAVARPGHPLFAVNPLVLTDLLNYCWIVPPVGSVMRHKFDLMFQEFDLQQLTNRVETSSLLFLTKMMLQSDMVSIMAVDVARYYSDHGMLRILPVVLPCEMEPFGFITRRDKPLSPATEVLLSALKVSALTVYGKQFDVPVP
ncbi:LysR family transcriptional regulator [Rhodoferax sp.]|uniref:LysR family transcriptional regulator n=1 Tax=Rhodoferax sp. TaxID=50421 RepID=UPI00283E6C5F|nr:LysR family transcriptional regulator [Rhodoferax sp.]MDR3371934.1 LysR family transcriptional regulator [Rhodoferax sp.]